MNSSKLSTASKCLLILMILGLTGGTSLADAHWPMLFGPTGQSHAPAATPPTEWSEQQNIVWKTEIPESGWSSPVVHGDQIWLTSATEDGREMFALCIDLQTGEIIRNIPVFTVDEPEPANRFNSYASPTPVVEEGRVYVHFGTYGTAAIDTASGEILWQRRDLNLDHQEGPGGSPILFEDLLIFNCDGRDVQYVIALDKQTGETAWKTDRSLPELPDIWEDRRKAFTTPVVWRVGDELQLISQGAQATYAYDPRTGQELWRLPLEGFSNVSHPAFGEDRMFLSTGYVVPHLVAVRLDQTRGELPDSHILWRLERSHAPRRTSPIYVDGLLYTVADNGIAQAVEPESGETLWRERLGGEFSATPLYAGGHLYFFGQDGVTTVIKPGREFDVVARNELDAGFWASPAVVEDDLIVRTRTHLYRIGQSN